MAKKPTKRGSTHVPPALGADDGLGPAEPYVFATEEAELEAEVAIAAAEAENDFYARKPNVNFRWEQGPLDVIRRAADLVGVPYQTWMKQVLYEKAIATISAAHGVDPRTRNPLESDVKH
jgi:predicted DNA binding CopG/RHH family protein